MAAVAKKMFLVLGLVVFVSYYPALEAGFAYDDFPAILKNGDVSLKSGLSGLFHHDFWGTDIKDHQSSHKSYRPVTVLAFALDRSLALATGLPEPFVFHLTNLLLHWANSWLMYIYLTTLIKDTSKRWGRSVAAISSVLFAVHPVHVESVTGLVGKADLLYSWCVLAAVVLGLKLKRIFALVSSTTILAVLAVLCKEQGIMLLPISVCQDLLLYLFPQRRRSCSSGKYCIAIVAAKFALCLALVYWRLKLMDFESPRFQVGDNPAAFIESRVWRTVNLWYLYALNFWLLLVPDWLCFDWSMGCLDLVGPADIGKTSVAAVFLAASAASGLKVATLVVDCCRSKKAKKNGGKEVAAVAMSTACLVLPFIPASNAFFTVGFVVAERNLYLSSLGFCVLVGLGFSRLRINGKVISVKPLAEAGMVGLILTHAARCHLRSCDWRDEERLFMSGLRVCPKNAKIYYNLAKLWSDDDGGGGGQGQEGRVVAFYRKAIELWPNYEHALNNLANILKRMPSGTGFQGEDKFL